MFRAEIFSFVIAIHAVLWFFGVALRRLGGVSVENKDDDALVRLSLCLFWGGVAVFSGPPIPLLVAEFFILWYSGNYMIAWGLKGDRIQPKAYHLSLSAIGESVLVIKWASCPNQTSDRNPTSERVKSR